MLAALGAGALVAWHGGFARAAAAPRVVVLDWPLTEIVLSLGVVPVGISRPPWYARLDGDPALPASVVDTGLLFQPNFEVLEALRPDLIVVTPWHAPLRTLLERVAPVCPVQLFGPGIDVLTAVGKGTQALARQLGCPARAEELSVRAAAQFDATSARLVRFRASGRPVYLLRPIDDRHISVFGRNSLFGGVLARLGIENAWRGDTDPQGATEAELAALAARPDAHAVTIGVPPGVGAQLAQSPLWRALPFAGQNRVSAMGALPTLGGFVAAMRFARGLEQALDGAAA